MRREEDRTRDMNRGRMLVDHYNEILNWDMYDSDAISGRGIGYALLGKYDKAIEDCNLSIELDSDDYDGYESRGRCYEIMEEYNKAIEDYTKALELNKYRKLSLLNRGNCYETIGEYSKSIEDHKEVIELIIYDEYIDREDHSFFKKEIADHIAKLEKKIEKKESDIELENAC